MRRVRAPVVRPQTKPILPGRVQPTWHDTQWSIEADRANGRYPARELEARNILPGQYICPMCHSISHGRLWHMDEQEYQRLRRDPNVKVQLCPADQRILRQMYDGEVILQGDWIKPHKEEVLNWVRNEEKRTRATNPMARLARVEERNGAIYILTTTQALARRIGSGMKSAFKGRLKVQRLPYEAFTRVRWARD